METNKIPNTIFFGKAPGGGCDRSPNCLSAIARKTKRAYVDDRRDGKPTGWKPTSLVSKWVNRGRVRRKK